MKIKFLIKLIFINLIFTMTSSCFAQDKANIPPNNIIFNKIIKTSNFYILEIKGEKKSFLISEKKGENLIKCNAVKIGIPYNLKLKKYSLNTTITSSEYDNTSISFDNQIIWRGNINEQPILYTSDQIINNCIQQ
ncbi:hypothetical protein [Chryseobacterium kwangjuense]|uniref:Uncharacterized protein n=1 Tax=Chryseobacterium kwangjuense TaxID=267125 RepID=A0A135WFN6_9FLAO|nr:hypothetical protein [Chryseobacterium kwangjuense]KXH83721.1 hypothetical protein AU378_22725 [Chryseobacterium kwangjuense]